MNTTIIEAKQLGLKLGNSAILDGLDFSIAKGSATAVIGCNGAGKSSLIKCLAGIYRNYHGHIYLGNHDYRQLRARERARKIAYVPQAATETPVAFTVADFVWTGRFPHLSAFSSATRADHNAVEQALVTAEVSDLTARRLDTLSGGEYQRVMVAAALAQQAEILLLDEPSAYLDYQHQDEIIDLIRRLNRQEGTTVIMVTHDLNTAQLLCEQVLALDQGRISFAGPTSELLTDNRLESIFHTSFRLLDDPDNGIKVIAPRSGGQQ